MVRCTILLAAVALAAVQAPAQDAKSPRVYFVGNSVTDTIIAESPSISGVLTEMEQVWPQAFRMKQEFQIPANGTFQGERICRRSTKSPPTFIAFRPTCPKSTCSSISFS